jgi:hypothetical protein
LAFKKTQVKPPFFFPVMAIKIIANGRGLLSLCLLRKKAGFRQAPASFSCTFPLCWLFYIDLLAALDSNTGLIAALRGVKVFKRGGLFGKCFR